VTQVRHPSVPSLIQSDIAHCWSPRGIRTTLGRASGHAPERVTNVMLRRRSARCHQTVVHRTCVPCPGGASNFDRVRALGIPAFAAPEARNYIGSAARVRWRGTDPSLADAV